MISSRFACLPAAPKQGMQSVVVGTTAPENYSGPLWAKALVVSCSTIGTILWTLALIGPALYTLDFKWMLLKIYNDLWKDMKQRVYEAEVF